VYYAVEQPGRGNRLERQPSAGGGKPETIVDGRAGAISADGDWLAYSSGYRESSVKLFKLRLDGDRTPSVLLEASTGRADSRAEDPAISPNQRFVAYVINGSMSDDGISVRRFPDGDGQWQLDAAGGRHPRWSAKGDRLYFERNNELWEIEVRLGDTPAFSRASRLFAGQDSRSWPSYYGYDVSADGRFLLVANRMQSVAPVMTLIENWHLQFANRK
jgi:Tol biopolymer transport system component